MRCLIGVFLTIIASSCQNTEAQSWYDEDPIPVFMPDYHEDNYKIIYLLKDNTIITIERKNDTQEENEYLLLKGFSKNCFVSLYCIAEGQIWVAVKTIQTKYVNSKVTEDNQKRYQAILDETNKPNTIFLDTKKSWNTQILHRFKNNTELCTYFMALNKPRDYEENIKIATGTSPLLPARLIIEPSYCNEMKVYAKNILPLKIATEEQAKQLLQSQDAKDLNSLGMYYYSQNPPQLNKSLEIFERSYKSIPSSRIEEYKSKRVHAKDDVEVREANCGLLSIQTLLRRRAFTIDPFEAIKETDKNAAKREADLLEMDKVREGGNAAFKDNSIPILADNLNPKSTTNPQ